MVYDNKDRSRLDKTDGQQGLLVEDPRDIRKALQTSDLIEI